MAVASWMRAAHRDREETIAVLGQAYAKGRQEHAEFDQRTDAALRAMTIGQLRALIADIPRHGSAVGLPSDQPWRPGPAGPPRQPATRSPRAGLLMVLAALVCLVVAVTMRNPAVIALAVSAGLGVAALRRG